jgi:hypothetical protein
MTRHLGRSIALATVLAMPLAAPTALHAQTQTKGWTFCSTGAFQSCNSVQLTTLAVMVGADRVGTDITVSMHNFNGQSGDDNTLWSGLGVVAFYNSAGGSLGGSYEVWPDGPLSLSGDAFGSGNWAGYTERPYIGVSRSAYDGVIGGCAGTDGTGPGAYWATGYYTCDPDALASISFRTVFSFNASDFNSFSAAVVGQRVGSERFYSGFCTYGAYSALCGQPGCNIASSVSFFAPGTPDPDLSVVPEPVTIVLLATGLFGIAGAQLRRRKKDQQIDA